MFAVTTGGGLVMAEVDVCQTPSAVGPLPMPYPNIGSPSMGMPPVTNVLIGGAPALNMGSKMQLSNGDEPGVNGGLLSGKNMGQVAFILGSATVLIGGSPAVRLTAQTSHNANNAIGAVLAPSQTTVMIMS
jgi:uncharacterized Zn-binding protein involved in type VI secretion